MLSSSVLSSTGTVTARTTVSPLNNCIRIRRTDPSSSLTFSHRTFNPLCLRSSFTPHYGIKIADNSKTRSITGGFRVHSYVSSPFTTPNLQWISAVSALILILARGTTVPKSFIVPLFALQAPAGVFAWIKGRYGVWSAFLALVVRLFFHIP
ncbi:cold-regulated 413 inner membrane protein chloroplastic-like protein, partial [Trifolium pratense]